MVLKLVQIAEILKSLTNIVLEISLKIIYGGC